jgi:AcrR family transcriptional regulator
MANIKPTRREEQKEATRKNILDVAEKLFAEKGFADTTTRDIAREANVAAGTVFMHFPDKSSLLAATLHEGIEEVLQNAYTTLPDDLLIKEKLLCLARALYAHNFQTPALTTILLKETLFMEGEWGETFQAQSMGFIGKATELLVEAQVRGELKEDANCPLIATAFFSNYFMILINALRENIPNTDTQIGLLSQLTDLNLSSAIS